jgi:aldose 1-epimerase
MTGMDVSPPRAPGTSGPADPDIGPDAGPDIRPDIGPDIGRAPSGTQVELRYGSQSVTVVEVGGGLRCYTAGGRALLDGYQVGERCTDARGQILAPWPNRLRDGSYAAGGQHYQLPLTEPARRNAIHGLVRWARWSVAEQREDRAALTYSIPPQSGWPFTLDLRVDYELGPAGLAVTTTGRNAGPQPCPYGVGSHPYIIAGAMTIDGLRLRAPGARRLLTDDRGIPAGDDPVTGTEYDFRAGVTIGSAALDTGYRDLERDEDGLAWVVLADDSSGEATGVWLDQSYPFLMLFTGDSLPDPARRRRALGVEPMTCAPNALQTEDGLAILQPGDCLTSRWGITPTPPRPRA